MSKTVSQIALPSASVLWADWQREGSVHKVGALYGRCGETVRAHLLRAGYRLPRNQHQLKDVSWTSDEVDLLKRWYASHASSNDFSLGALSKKLRRNKANVSRKARALGLTNLRRRKIAQSKLPLDKQFDSDEARNQATSDRMRRRLKENGHPRGALGMKHTDATRRVLSQKAAGFWANLAPRERTAFVRKCMDARERKGTLVRNRTGTSWKAGWREIGGITKFYRSQWEANYARYLEWLKSKGQIASWQHEPKTFWFERIKRGCRSYVPDFLVVENDGREAYHEVKGWMDDRSKTKINRMRIYYPKVTLLVIDGKQYGQLKSQVDRLVPGWE